MSSIGEHHVAWLSAHQDRTEEWLRARLKDGFDVHHIDGNHANNDPLNLVLIEHSDHFMLHTGVRTLGRLRTRPRGPRPLIGEDLRNARIAYDVRRLNPSRPCWGRIGREYNIDKADSLAKRYAREYGLPYPPPRPPVQEIKNKEWVAMRDWRLDLSSY